MHIALVSHAYPRWRGDVAGAFIARLAVALVRRGHAVTAIVPADGGVGGRTDVDGVTVQRYRYAPASLERLAHRGTMVREAATPWGAIAFWRLVRTASEEITRLHPDVVHAHWWVPGGWSAVRAARRGAPGPVVTLHGSDIRLVHKMPLARPMAARILRQARTVTAVSGHLAVEAKRLLGGADRDVPVTPMPAELLTGPTEEPEIARAGIITVARLVPQKRTDLLLRAVASLHRSRPTPLTIVGDGPERGRLERLAANLRLDVRFTGAIPPQNVASILREAKVGAFLGRHEGLGLAAIEALMCGVPIVTAADGGGLPEIAREGNAGRVVMPSPPAVAAAMAELMDDQHAGEAARAAGTAWRSRLDADAVAARFEEIYTDAA